MSFTTQEVNDVVMVNVSAERATFELSGQFKDELLEKISAGRTNLVVDLSSSEFVDSSFLGALVTGLKSASKQGGELKIVGLQPAVRALFELTRLHRIFDIFESTEDALNSF